MSIPAEAPNQAPTLRLRAPQHSSGRAGTALSEGAVPSAEAGGTAEPLTANATITAASHGWEWGYGSGSRGVPESGFPFASFPFLVC